MHGAQLHLYTDTYISTSRVMCSLFFSSSYTLNCRFQFLSFHDLYLFHLYRASFMTRVVFSQLVILHQAVSVITSLESQVRGELLTCVIVCVYEQVIIVMMMILVMTTMIYSVFSLFVCLFVSCMPKAVLFREVGKTYIKARVRFESVFS